MSVNDSLRTVELIIEAIRELNDAKGMSIYGFTNDYINNAISQLRLAVNSELGGIETTETET